MRQPPRPLLYKHVPGWTVIPLGLALIGCGGPPNTDDALGQPRSAPLNATNSMAIAARIAPPVTSTRTLGADLLVAWRATPNGTVLRKGQSLTAELINQTETAVSGQLVVVASGLDGQIVRSELGPFTVGPRATTEARLPIASLPIQSEESTAFAVIQAEYLRRDGVTVRIPTAPLYYYFRNGYQDASFHDAVDVVQRLNGGVLTNDPMRVRGRVKRADGRWSTIDTGAQTTAGARVGLTQVTMAPLDADGAATGCKPPPRSRRPQALCTRSRSARPGACNTSTPAWARTTCPAVTGTTPRPPTRRRPSGPARVIRGAATWTRTGA